MCVNSKYNNYICRIHFIYTVQHITGQDTEVIFNRKQLKTISKRKIDSVISINNRTISQFNRSYR